MLLGRIGIHLKVPHIIQPIESYMHDAADEVSFLDLVNLRNPIKLTHCTVKSFLAVIVVAFEYKEYKLKRSRDESANSLLQSVDDSVPFERFWSDSAGGRQCLSCKLLKMRKYVCFIVLGTIRWGLHGCGWVRSRRMVVVTDVENVWTSVQSSHLHTEHGLLNRCRRGLQSLSKSWKQDSPSVWLCWSPFIGDFQSVLYFGTVLEH